MKVPEELIQTIYDVSIQVYENETERDNAVALLTENGRMNPSTAGICIDNLGHMVRGEKYQRALNQFVARYFLANIFSDFGPDSLAKALQSLKLHTDYYESCHQNRPYRIMRSIYDEYLLLIVNNLDQVQQEAIIEQVTNQSWSKETIVDKLNQMKPMDDEIISFKGMAYKRNNYVVALLKRLHDFKCQLCGLQIPKKNGGYYIEAAHIHPKRMKGPEIPDNILILCPNHHKEFDYGDRSLISYSQDKIEFTLNNKSYSIKRVFRNALKGYKPGTGCRF